jgi:hypothetical protein
MKTKAKSKMNFRDKIKGQVEKSKESGKKNYGYLKIPKGINVYSVDIPKKLMDLKVKFDIMPYIVKDAKHPDRELGAEVGGAWWRRPVKVHRNIGVNNESVICPTTIGKKCPICEHQKKISGEGATKEEVKALSPSYRSIFIVRPKEDKNFEDDYHVFDISDYNFYTPFMVDVEEGDQYNFPSLDDGMTIECKFHKESFMGNSFPQAIRTYFRDRDEQYGDEVLDEVPNLDDMIQILSYEDLKIKYFEIDEDEEDGGKLEDDDDDDDEPKRKSKPKLSAGKKKPVVEDEDEEEDDDDEDEEDEKPVSKKKPVSKPDPKASSKKKPAPVEDDDDEEEEDDEEDDDEEETPPAKKGASKPMSRKPAATGKKKPAPVEEDDEDDEDEEEDDEEEIDIPVKERCVACSGTGKNSRGKDCVPCDGTGRKKKVKPVEDDDDDKPVNVKNKKKVVTQTTTSHSKNKCPHGHKFGVDTEDFDECDDCALWDACIDAKEKK